MVGSTRSAGGNISASRVDMIGPCGCADGPEQPAVTCIFLASGQPDTLGLKYLSSPLGARAMRHHPALVLSGASSADRSKVWNEPHDAVSIGVRCVRSGGRANAGCAVPDRARQRGAALRTRRL